MKIDRILGIIIYLFNHDKVSAKTLAEKYDVSVRTIQRDMVNIASCGCQACFRTFQPRTQSIFG